MKLVKDDNGKIYVDPRNRKQRRVQRRVCNTTKGAFGAVNYRRQK